MNSAAAVIEALNARDDRGRRLREAGRVSWRIWIDRQAERPGSVSGAAADDLVSHLAARPLARPPRRSLLLNRWQAFGTLWRQQWHPASRDERAWRWTAGGISFGWHVLLAILLLWITALHFLQPLPKAPDDAVQVEYIGQGTPEEPGGGDVPAAAPSAQAESPAAAQTTASVADAAAPARPSPAQRTTQAAAPVATTVTPAEPSPAQPVTTSQPVATSKPVSPQPPVFELPPTTIQQVAVTPQAVAIPEVRALPVPEPVSAPELSMPTPELVVEPVRAPSPPVAQQEVPVPRRAPALRVPAPAADVAVERAPAAAARPSPSPAAANRPATAPMPEQGTTPAVAGRAVEPGPRVGPSTSTSAGVGAGPKPAPAPGSWASPRRADDWGDSTRNRPGTRGAGINDGNGRPRLGEAPGSASAGFPPGMVTQEIRDLDRSGTWLKRKPYPYEPTAFDRFWRPNETLLQEWVRRGIRQVGVPIPGTNKRIVCVVSILQLGGGCGVVDPDLNDQPATARPPPDVPFKPYLQEGNGATPPAPGRKPPASEPFPIPPPVRAPPPVPD